jgi:O-antigen ligase/polysaccharide polymerase Wzy-like membrane protein
MGTLGVKATIGLDNKATQRALAPAANFRLPAQGLEPGQSWTGKLAFGGSWLFIVFYYIRPPDWYPPAAIIPLGKITALLALGGFALVLLERGGVLHLPKETIAVVLLFVHLCLTIPFAVWRGGSFQVVVMEFSKVVLIVVSLVVVITTMARLRKLLFVQAAAVTAMAIFAATGRSRLLLPNEAFGDRVKGAEGGLFENPNDLAFIVALTFPLCFAFMLTAKGWLRKAFWAVGLVLMVYTVMITYSRGGLIAMAVGAAVTLWEFGVKGRRYHLILLTALAGIFLIVAGSPANYADRVKSIFDPDSDPTGSSQARRDLFYQSVDITKQHPLLGVGPGNFQVISGTWHATHDSYTQLSAEGGIPALLLFVLILMWAFSNVRLVQKIVPRESELGLLASALRASLASFVVGALFSSVPYQFFPYILFAFATAAYQIALHEQGHPSPPVIRLPSWNRGIHRSRALDEGAHPRREWRWNREP